MTMRAGISAVSRSPNWPPLLLLIVFALRVITGIAAESLSDVTGWQNVPWGTSPSELKKLYGNRLTIDRARDGGEISTIKEYELFGESFEVRFLWKDGNKLKRVSVGILEAARDLSGVAENIVASIRSKYGSGQVVEHEETKSSPFYLSGRQFYNPGRNRLKIRWAFPSTLITYEHQIADLGPGEPRPSFISIFYEPNEAGKL